MLKIITLLVFCFYGILIAKEVTTQMNFEKMSKDELLVKLKKTEDSNIKNKKEIYSQLFHLEPNNAEYRENFIKYQKQSNALLSLEKLKTLKNDELEEKKSIYETLVNVFPDNNEYKEKLQKCIDEIKKQEERESIELSLIGDKPIMNNWDGSYSSVKQYLKQSMHDPSSLEFIGCTKVYRVKGKGWVVGCKFRGSNAFGAKVLNANWFTIVQNKVIKVEPHNTYTFE